MSDLTENAADKLRRHSQFIRFIVNGEHDKVIADFDEAIRLNPNFALAYYYRGLAWAKEGNTEKSKADFKRAKELGFVPLRIDQTHPALDEAMDSEQVKFFYDEYFGLLKQNHKLDWIFQPVETSPDEWQKTLEKRAIEILSNLGVTVLVDENALEGNRLIGLDLKDLETTRKELMIIRMLRLLECLKMLNLENTNVTDEELEYLKGHAHLQELWLDGTKVTQAGIDKLKLALPKCEIKWYGECQMQSFATKSIFETLESVKSDELTPATISPETTAFVYALAKKYYGDENIFSNFILRLPHDALKLELLNQIVPDSLKKNIKTLREDHEQLAAQKEKEIENEDFQAAANCRDKQEEIADEITKLVGGKLVIEPDHLINAIRLLGFEEDLSS